MGRPPKPAHLRQRTNKKAGIATLEMPTTSHDAPPIPNPDDRIWHPLTLAAWAHAWASPMASQWLETDTDALGRLAVLWDAFYQAPGTKVLAEIRLQEQRFGFSPLDRSRLQWEIKRAEAPERTPAVKPPTIDPRKALMAVS